jgi:hypothetical protein
MPGYNPTVAEMSMQKSVAHRGRVVAGARQAARDRGLRGRTVIAIGIDVKGVDVAGEVYFPIAGFHIDSGQRLCHWTEPAGGADSDRTLDSSFHT